VVHHMMWVNYTEIGCRRVLKIRSIDAEAMELPVAATNVGGLGELAEAEEAAYGSRATRANSSAQRSCG
jgi:hypothetical protein